ncbi:ADAMTS-like protein 3 [Manis javanica]|nr:ADAMTS-like protein 3 [Manis javanica]
MSRACNTDPCPPRWHTSPWGPCSATCGVGIQTRDVCCLHPGESPAPPAECRDAKPHTLQACNQFDCPPSWHIEEWQRCSGTCGGGTQNQRITCRQLLTDGSILSLSDEWCPGPKASSHKSYARTDCPPQLALGDWSKCSVSCGVGIQRREQVLPDAYRKMKPERFCRNTNSWESGKKWFGAAIKQGAHSMDAAQFDELIRNMSQLLDAGEEVPVILSVERNITRLEPGHLSVVVGGLMEAALGATVAIRYPVREHCRGHEKQPRLPARG